MNYILFNDLSMPGCAMQCVICVVGCVFQTLCYIAYMYGHTQAEILLTGHIVFRTLANPLIVSSTENARARSCAATTRRFVSLSESVFLMASWSAVPFPVGTSKPSLPSVITSLFPAIFVAITGVPKDMASMSVCGNPSYVEFETNTSAILSHPCNSGRGNSPMKCTRPPNERLRKSLIACACDSRDARSGPSPTITKCHGSPLIASITPSNPFHETSRPIETMSGCSIDVVGDVVGTGISMPLYTTEIRSGEMPHRDTTFFKYTLGTMIVRAERTTICCNRRRKMRYGCVGQNGKASSSCVTPNRCLPCSHT